MGARKKLWAGLAAATMVATAGVSLDTGRQALGQQAPPPAPPIRQFEPTEPVVPDDGRHRVVVTVPGPGLTTGMQPGADSDTGTTSETAGTGAPDNHDGAGAGPADATWLERLPSDTTLVTGDDGELGFVDADGRFHTLDEPGRSSGRSRASATGAGETAQPDAGRGEAGSGGAGTAGGGPVLELLGAVPGVESVQAITDRSYAIEASSLEGLEHLGLDVTPQTFYRLTDDPYERYQWALDNTGDNLTGVVPNVAQSTDADVDGAEARSRATGRGVVVAVIDSGVDLAHPELAHAAWVNPGEDCGAGSANGVDDDGNGYVDDCAGWDFGDNDRVSFDGSNNPHGTHVAGIVAARAGNGRGIAGIAPDATIMDLKVADRYGAIPSSGIARAIRYAVDNGAHVVNLSLGSRPGDPPAPEVAEAVAYAGSNGVLLVVAAGNDGISLDRAPVYPASLNADHMLVVGATDPADNRTSFSNHGSAVDLFAPGLYVLSTTPGGNLEFQSGTSQAAPTVAAAAALAIEASGRDDSLFIVDRLTASGDGLEQLIGLAANPVRLNAARAVGAATGDAGAAGAITLRGLAADPAGRVSASVAIAVEDGRLDQAHNWEASLFAVVDGRPYAVTDHPVAAGPAQQVRDQVTDGQGTIGLAPSGTPAASWSTVLPGGTYALLIEAVPEGDPTVRLGDGFLATFQVPVGSPDDGSGSGTGDGPSTSGGPTTDSGSDPRSDGPNGGSPGSIDPSTSVDGSSSESSGPDGPATSGPSGDDDGSYQPPVDGTGAGDDLSATGQAGTGSGTGDSADGATGSTGGPSGGDAGPTGSGATGAGSGSDPEATTGTSAGGSGSAGSGPVTPNPDADTGSNGPWSVSSILPQIGYVDTENLVQLIGRFPEPVTVWFGESPARTILQAPDLLVVTTQRHADAGLVDVTLRRQEQSVLTLPAAYGFAGADDGSTVGDGPASGGSAPGDSLGGGGYDGDSPDGGSTDGGSTGDSTGDPTGPDGSTGGGGGGSDDDSTSIGDTGRPQRRPVADGEPVDLAGGLTGVPVTGLGIPASTPLCGVDPCRAARI